MPEAKKESGTPQTAVQDGSQSALVALLEGRGINLGGEPAAAAPADAEADAAETENPPREALSQQTSSQEEGAETREEAEPEAEAAEPEAEAEVEAEPTDIEKLEHGYEKRLAKEVAKRKELEERLEDLEGKLADTSAEARAPEPNDAGPLARVETLAKLNKQAGMARRYHDSAEEHLDAIEDTGDTAGAARWLAENGVKLAEDADAAQIKPVLKRILRNTGRVLQDVPERREWLQRSADADQKAVAEYPWLKDKTSAEFTVFQSVVQTLPSIRNLPHWKFAAAVYVEGLAARAARLKTAAAKGKTPAVPAKAPPKVPGKPGSSPAQPQGRGAKVSAAMMKVEKEPTRQNLDEALEQLLG